MTGMAAAFCMLVEQRLGDKGLSAHAAVEPLSRVDPLVDLERALLPKGFSTI